MFTVYCFNQGGRKRTMNGGLLDDAGESLRLLSLLLAPPGKTLLQLLRSDPGLPGGGWSERCPDDGELLERLQEEHTRLFVTGFPRLAAPPYATEYLDDEPGRLLAGLEQRLRAMGFQVDASGAGRPDHLRVLLEAAGHLGDAGERHEFLDRYLVSWLPRYRERLQAAARLPFYPALLGAAESLVQSEMVRERHGCNRRSGCVRQPAAPTALIT